MLKHCVINDVSTHWNSSYDMVDYYLNSKQLNSCAALTLRALKNKEIVNLTDVEMSVGESVNVEHGNTVGLYDLTTENYGPKIYGT